MCFVRQLRTQESIYVTGQRERDESSQRRMEIIMISRSVFETVAVYFPVDQLSSVYLWPLIICHIYKLVQPKKRCFISFVWIISKRLVTKIHPVVKNLECFETFSLCFSFIFHFQFPVVTQMYVCAYVLVGFRTETSCYGFRKTGSVALIASVWSLR